MHPSHTSLMPVSARDALERAQGSAGEHLKSSTKEFQSFQPNLNASLQVYTACRIKNGIRNVHSCRSVVSLASHRHGGMAPVTGVLEWKYTGFWGRTEEMRRGCHPLSMTRCTPGDG